MQIYKCELSDIRQLAVLNLQLIEDEKSDNPMYLRHFFVCREYRRNGCGKAFFGDLLKELGVRTIDIEVYSWNETGKRFWESLGFSPRCIYMRYQENQ